MSSAEPSELPSPTLESSPYRSYEDALRQAGAEITIEGHFNPRIFHPLWFSSERLISRQEAENAKLEVIHPEIAAWSIGWLSVEVSDSRFRVFTTSHGLEDRARDFVVTTLRILSHTPVSAMTLSFHRHLDLPRGTMNVLEPFVPSTDLDKVIDQPAASSLTIDSQHPEYLASLTIEPSTQIDGGLFLGYARRREIASATSGDPVLPGRATSLAALLVDDWPAATDQASRAFVEVYEMVLRHIAASAGAGRDSGVTK